MLLDHTSTLAEGVGHRRTTGTAANAAAVDAVVVEDEDVAEAAGVSSELENGPCSPEVPATVDGGMAKIDEDDEDDPNDGVSSNKPEAEPRPIISVDDDGVGRDSSGYDSAAPGVLRLLW